MKLKMPIWDNLVIVKSYSNTEVQFDQDDTNNDVLTFVINAFCYFTVLRFFGTNISII